MKYSIRYKLLIWFLPIALLPALIVGYVSHVETVSNTQYALEKNIASITLSASQKINAFFREKKRDATTLAKAPIVQKYLWYFYKKKSLNGVSRPYRLYAELQNYLQQHLERFEYYDIQLFSLGGDTVFFLDKRVNNISNLLKGHHKETELSKAFILSRQTLLPVTSKFGYVNFTDVNAVFTIAPVFFNKRVIGFVAIQHRETSVLKLLELPNNSGRTSDALLYFSNKEQLNFISSKHHQQANKAYRESTVNSSDKQGIAAKLAIKGDSGKGYITDLNLKPIYAAWRYLPELDLGLVTKINKDEVLNPIYQLNKWYWIITVVIVFIITALIWFISGTLTKPIKSLSNAMVAIGKGDLSIRAKVKGNDEISTLAKRFNDMVVLRLMHEERLVELDKLKDDFLANTSHELRTPLNGIVGIAESLVSGVAGSMTEKAKENLNLIIISGKRLNNLVNDILDFSKLRHQDLKLNFRSVNIYHITELVIQISKHMIKAKDVKLINKLNQDTPSVWADENRLQQILYNLISNAIKFTHQGSITIDYQINEPNIDITITDTGIGIPKDKLGVIFESFEQVDSSITRAQMGTGLGLPISKKLAELHHGHLLVDSLPQQGSTFTLSLPINKNMAKKIQAVTQRHNESQQTLEVLVPQEVIRDEEVEEVSIPPLTNYSATILAVDDDAINLQVLSNQLSLQGHRVITASSGTTGLELLETQCPDLILLDVMMPIMSGFEVCEAIRKNYPLDELPIIMLTAKNKVSDLEKGFVSGASDYICKPFSQVELLSRIKAHLDLSLATKLKAEHEKTITELNKDLEIQVVERTEKLNQSLLQLKQSQEQIIQSEKVLALRGIVIGVSHELNTPIGVCLTASSVLIDTITQFGKDTHGRELNASAVEQYSSSMLECSNIIYANITRAVDLINNFKQLSVDQSIEKCRDFDIKNYINMILHSLSPKLNNPPFKVNFECEPNFIVYADPGVLAQLLTNFIDNSLSHGFEGMDAGQIDIKISKVNGSVQLKYSDTGSGISKADIKKIYEPFFTTKLGKGGSGLGLHIVYNLVTDSLGGTIQCTSSLAEGTLFEIVFPVITHQKN